MINSIRKKFILVSVLTTTFVIFTVFFTINLLNYFNIVSRSDEILDKVKNDSIVLNSIIKENVGEGNLGLISPDRTFYGNFLVSEIKGADIINVYSTNKNISNEYIRGVSQKAILKDNENGFVDYFRYTYVKNSDDKYIIFVDSSRDLSIFYSFLKNSAFVALTIIIAVSFSMAILSKRITYPMEENYIKQKQFITDASHELKTPLTIISSNADVLEIEVGDSKWLANIKIQIERLTNLINSLVTFSKAEEKEYCELSNFSLSNLLQQRIDEFEELAVFKSKQINGNIQKDIFYLGELDSITNVIDILLDNAIKYADSNTVVDVNLFKSKKMINLSVKNYAYGLKKGNLNKVFDRFYRLDESGNSEIQGYGIGLSLAKLIIDKHNSTINACAPKDHEFLISTNSSSNSSLDVLYPSIFLALLFI